MAQENIEWLRAGYEAFNRTGIIDVSNLDPDFELHQASSIVDTAGVFRGPEALRQSLGELTEAFEKLSFEAEGLLEAPDGRVVALIHARGRGRGSGLEIDNQIAHVWTFCDGGRAIKLVVFEEPAEALEAVGLEEAMSKANVEVVRRWLWAFENDTDAFRDTLHPEIEWSPFEEAHSPSFGVESAMRLRNQWLDTWDEHRVDLEEVIQEGDSVVATLRVAARGKGSGVEVDVRLHFHFKVRDGKVAYLFEHEDRAAALEAAGLKE